MKVLVTGGAGFIGSHIVDALVERGNEVRVVDDFSTGRREYCNPTAKLFEADIRNLEAIRPAFSGIETVFHEAALPRVQQSIDNPLETNAVNVTGTINVLLASRDAGVRRVIYAASSAAYGDPVSLPLSEDMKVNPKSPYGLQKYVGEEYLKLAALFWGLETVSLRYFNVYGPRMSDVGAYATVIAIFNRQKRAGEPLTITGDGTQTRDFTHIDDVVRANLLALESAAVGKGEVINIGAGEHHSVNEVAALVGGPTKQIAPRVEPHDTQADITRARTLLGWEPQVPFAVGVASTVAWYQRQPLSLETA